MDSSDQYIAAVSKRLRELPLSRSQWIPSDALVSKNGAIEKYLGQSYDSNEKRIVPLGFGHDTCPFCFAIICNDASGHYISEGFTNGVEWVCPTCYEKHLAKHA